MLTAAPRTRDTDGGGVPEIAVHLRELDDGNHVLAGVEALGSDLVDLVEDCEPDAGGLQCYSACMRGRLSERRHLAESSAPQPYSIQLLHADRAVRRGLAVPCKDLEMSSNPSRTVARYRCGRLDAITDLFRLPDRRIGDSRVLFIEDVADILSQVRDLSLRQAPSCFGQQLGYKADGIATFTTIWTNDAWDRRPVTSVIGLLSR